ncbi:MAG: dihydroorotate dehydrogenase [Candidatus Micrarchaeia archaeon]
MLETSLCGIRMKNPTMLASGILGLTGASIERVAQGGAGAAVTKCLGKEQRVGFRNPTVIAYEHYVMNAMGMCNPGIENYKEELGMAKKSGIPIIANVFGGTPEEFAYVASRAEEYGADGVELNVSCPNVIEGEKLGMVIGKDAALVENVVSAVKSRIKVPVFVKLTPNVSSIEEIALAAERGGADGITAINTLGPGLAINIEARKPILGNKFGGVSGPAIKPIALACVYKIYEKVSIPIIGVGGITTGRDAIEMMMAGARVVQVGSAVYVRGLNVFSKICKEIEGWLSANGYRSIEEIVGVAHE